MILDLTLTAAREQAKDAARAQGAAAILVRTENDVLATRWSVANVLAYLDRAERLERRGSVVTAQLRGDYTRHLYLPQVPALPLPHEEHADDASVVWEVDDAAGAVLYRGRDLELAHELALAETGGHLIARAVTA